MSLPWFRVYRELKDDPKMGALDDASFRVFIESLCWACEREAMGRTGLTVESANWAFRRNVTQPLQDLLQKRLLVLTPDGEIMVPKWEERQKSSDSSAERVRKFRALRNVTLQETLHVTKCNGAEESRGDESRVEQNGKAVARAPRFLKPSIDEVRLAAEKSGLPLVEAEKFFNYYESNGWRVGRNPMKSWPHAMINWRNNFQIYGISSKNSSKPNPRNAGTDIDADEVGRHAAEVVARRQAERDAARNQMAAKVD